MYSASRPTPPTSDEASELRKNMPPRINASASTKIVTVESAGEDEPARLIVVRTSDSHGLEGPGGVG
jgi:hypothetical protein